MSRHETQKTVHRRTIRDIIRQKGQSPVVCLTAYTAPVARAADEYCDLILVGDSLGMVLYGMDSTVPVTVDMMVNHGAAVVRCTAKALVVVDMPFGSYQESPEQAFRHAAHIMKQTGASAVKLEGGTEMAATISYLTRRGIPVMGHIGLQPQSVHAAGGYKVTGRDADERARLLEDARAVADAGAFSVVLECMDAGLADELTAAIAIPTIGIGASDGCDGQVLVTEDMLGMSGEDVPKFVKQYAALSQDIEKAVSSYADEVRSRSFPSAEYIYGHKKNKLKVMG